MSSQTVLLFASAIGILGLCLGIYITARKYNKTKSHLKLQIENAEKELEYDLQDITELELMKTQAGQELILMVGQNENNISPKPNLDTLDDLIIEAYKTKITFISRLRFIFVLSTTVFVLFINLFRALIKFALFPIGHLFKSDFTSPASGKSKK